MTALCHTWQCSSQDGLGFRPAIVALSCVVRLCRPFRACWFVGGSLPRAALGVRVTHSELCPGLSCWAPSGRRCPGAAPTMRGVVLRSSDPIRACLGGERVFSATRAPPSAPDPIRACLGGERVFLSYPRTAQRTRPIRARLGGERVFSTTLAPKGPNMIAQGKARCERREHRAPPWVGPLPSPRRFPR